MTVFLTCGNVENAYPVSESFRIDIFAVLKHRFPKGFLCVFEARHNFVTYLKAKA